MGLNLVCKLSISSTSYPGAKAQGRAPEPCAQLESGSLTSCVTLREWHNLSVPQMPSLSDESQKIRYSYKVLRKPLILNKVHSIRLSYDGSCQYPCPNFAISLTLENRNGG